MNLTKEITRAVKLLKKHKNDKVHLISHLDADGISSAGIMSKTLDREAIEHEISIVKLNKIKDTLDDSELTIFTDLGSGQLPMLNKEMKKEYIIMDHHIPQGKTEYHINPNLFGIDGSREVSGAGLSYFFSRNLGNKDLVDLAIVGAVGDMQNFWGRMEGLNQIILKEGIKNKRIKMEKNLLLYGRETRPVYKSLQYFSDPVIPGVTGDESSSIALLRRLGIDLKENERWRTLSDLSFEERKRLATEIIAKCSSSIPKELAKFLSSLVIGETYTLLNEEEGTPLRDASEYSTCLNATGRNDEAEIGVEIAKGNRGVYYDVLMGLLKKHRRKIAESIERVESITQREYIQFFKADISDNIIGTIAGMLLGTKADPYKPLIGIADSDNSLKISVRCSKLLVLKGVNMAKAIIKAAEAVDGEGGGHAPACGAYIPKNTLNEFLDIFEEEVKKQLET
ncbi:MAG: DHH family phosphoesterase [Euryarchaeota archaeon]|nr:DHH family phosphoesterase [Euryarchaeota archaeon]